MIFGIIIILVGIILLIDAAVPTFSIDFKIIWPTVLVLIGVYSIIKEKKYLYMELY